MNCKIAFSLLIGVVLLSCKKNGTGGKAQIVGTVTYNNNPVNPCTVYIKYGATSSPGTDPSNYDSQQAVSTAGTYTFFSMYPGDYYLYAIGNYMEPNSAYIETTGSAQVHISANKSITAAANIAAVKQ
ncbi:MAG: hypothetical protein JST67_11450 [Bacteroidetes bacterium]|nr:hypothetical protein [Bacteroidota bacterium]